MLGLAYAVDDHAVAILLGGQAPAAAGEHVHLDAVVGELLRELAHVAPEAPLDDRRVLPGDQEDAHGSPRVTLPAGASRRRGDPRPRPSQETRLSTTTERAVMGISLRAA